MLKRNPLWFMDDTKMTGAPHKHIFIYNGKGSDEESRKMLYHSMYSIADQDAHIVDYITAQDIKEGTWTKNCQLIAFGGGYDRGFNEAVGKEGMKKIQDFVASGGHYLGFCAGAYWACDHIEFDKEGPLEVVGERFLKFFPGLCIGPAFPGFQYNSTHGAWAVPVYHDKVGTLDTYMNGGGYFLPYLDKHIIKNDLSAQSRSTAATIRSQSQHFLPHPCSSPKSDTELKGHPACLHSSWKTLGVYSSLGSKPAAVVKCSVGKGSAILSGVHLEYPVKHLNKEDPHVSRWIPSLSLSEEKRVHVLTDLLKQLGVVVKQFKAIL